MLSDHRNFVTYITVSVVSVLGSSVGRVFASYASVSRDRPSVPKLILPEICPFPLTQEGLVVSY